MIRSARPALAALALVLAASSPWSAGAGAYRVLVPVDAMSPGHRAAYIAGIRAELAAHGYDPGSSGAELDARLAAAISAYQQDAGLPVDGVASKELLDHLKYVLPKVYAGYAPPGAGPAYPEAPLAPPAPYPEAGPGDWPDQASPQPPPGPEARPETGYWPDEVTSQPLPDLPEAPDEQTAAAPPPETPPAPVAPETEPRRTIGGVVSQVQAELKRRGYFPGPVDGRFTPETSAAVRRFQQDSGLAVDGVINSALLEALDAPPPSRSEAPTPLEGANGSL